MSAEVVALVLERKRSYQAIFGGARENKTPAWLDLEKFCFASRNAVMFSPDGAVDLNRTLIAQGRREVWLLIQQHLDLGPEELSAQYVALTKDTDT